jgi:hypothetical protein
MQVHLARVLPLVDVAGEELNQASLLRYLNELVWIQWATPFTDYGTLHGVRVPTAGWAEYRTGAEPLKYVELHVEPHQTGSKAPTDRRPDQRRWVRTDGGPR